MAPPTEAAHANTRARSWCFTINNPTEADDVDVRKIKLESKYLIVGKEVGETGTPHYQCYVSLRSAKTLSAMKRLSSRAHWEIAKADAEANFIYCSKDGTYTEYGTRPMTQAQKAQAGGEAEKQRWTHMRELAKVRDWTTFEAEYPRELTLYEGNFQRIAIQHAPTLDLEDNTVVGIWIYGPTGTGKTYHVMHNMVEERGKVYQKNISKWWDGYKQELHKLVLIDDLSKFHVKIADDLKVWVQEYEFNAEFKGGSFRIRPEQIVVTSNYRIDEIWEDAITRETLWRRFKCFKKMTKTGPLEEDI